MTKGDDKKQGKKPFRLQEHIEWIAMAWVLALTVKCFVVEAYQIPSGSMAPTLYGRHYRVDCPQCGEGFNVRGGDGDFATSHICPVCEKEGSSTGRVRLRGGDRILVAKDLYWLAPPKRWDVFVFKSPEEGHQTQNFVKRLVGMPGETLTLKDGQVFVDGVIVHKPERVQKQLWQDVYDSRHSAAATEYWRSGGEWEVKEGKLLLAQESELWQTVEYERPILDYYSYNGREGENVVGDVLVGGHVKLEGDRASFAAGVWRDDETIKAVFTPTIDTLTVELRRNEDLVRSMRSIITSPREFDFSLAVVDGTQKIKVNGVYVIENVEKVAVDDTPLYTKSSRAFFSGVRGKMFVSDVEIKRDVYYRSSLIRPDYLVQGPFVHEIGEGEYLGLGDNSPISSDGRVWGVVPAENVLGKAFVLFWPPSRVKAVF